MSLGNQSRMSRVCVQFMFIIPFLKAFKIGVVVDGFRHVVFNKINNVLNLRNVCNSFLAFFPDDNVSVAVVNIGLDDCTVKIADIIRVRQFVQLIGVDVVDIFVDFSGDFSELEMLIKDVDLLVC